MSRDVLDQVQLDVTDEAGTHAPRDGFVRQQEASHRRAEDDRGIVGGADAQLRLEDDVALSRRIAVEVGDQSLQLPKASGLAFEIDGGNGANQTSALENAETSAIGRALANAGYSGNKRTSREEMNKVERTSAAIDNWLVEADKISDIAGLRWLYAKAKAEGASPDVLERIQSRAKLLNPDVESDGADGGVPASTKKRPKE